jgi:hypothetical protein
VYVHVATNLFHTITITRITVWVVKVGPLNEFNQYDYAIVSNWVRYPVYVMARDPERFQKWYMRDVLEYLEKNSKRVHQAAVSTPACPRLH